MKTTTLVMLGLMATLVMGGGTASATATEASAAERDACEPVWTDPDFSIHYDLDCIDPWPRVPDNSP